MKVLINVIIGFIYWEDIHCGKPSGKENDEFI